MAEVVPPSVPGRVRRIVPHLGIDDTAASSGSTLTVKRETGWKCAMLVNRRSRRAALPSCRLHGQALTVPLDQQAQAEEPNKLSAGGASSSTLRSSDGATPLGPLGAEPGENINRVSVWTHWRRQDLIFACARCQEIVEERKAVAEEVDQNSEQAGPLCADAVRRRGERVAALYEAKEDRPAELRVSVVKAKSPEAEWAVLPVVLFRRSFPAELPARTTTLLCLHCPGCCMFYIGAPDATDLRHAHAGCTEPFANLALRWRPNGLRHLLSDVLPRTPLRWRGAGDANRVAAHLGVQCDGCGVLPIRGTRSTCTVCDDLDLCSECEQRQRGADTSLRHPHHLRTHPMLSLPRPEEIGLHRHLDMARARALLNMGADEQASMAVSLTSTGPGWPRSLFAEETTDQAAQVEAVICTICCDVAREAKVTPCGHVFCRFCLVTAVARSESDAQCPNDRLPFNSAEVLEATSSEDLAVRASIASFLVRCVHAEECAWTGELRLLEHHVHEDCHWRSCPLAPFGCTNVFAKHHLTSEKDWDHVDSAQHRTAPTATTCTDLQHQQLLRRHMLRGAAHVDRLSHMQTTLLEALQGNARMTVGVLNQSVALQQEAAALKEQCNTMVASLDDRGRAICNTAVMASLLSVRVYLAKRAQEPAVSTCPVAAAPSSLPVSQPEFRFETRLPAMPSQARPRAPLFVPRPFVRPVLFSMPWLPHAPAWSPAHHRDHRHAGGEREQEQQQQQLQVPVPVRQGQPPPAVPSTVRNAVDAVCAIQ
jgi:hypothetical protein